MNPLEQFFNERTERIAANAHNQKLLKSAESFMLESILAKYSYNFEWLGIPVIQYPQDLIASQEIIWQLKPDVIIETGVAHGGSVIFYSSLLELIGKGRVIGIDIDIREHNRKNIEHHAMFKRIELIEGSSVSKEVIEKLRASIQDNETVLVMLDSNHTHDHVLKELELYSDFVTPGSYLIVYDTIIESIPDTFFANRPWGQNNNPKTAVNKFLENNPNFEIDRSIENKILLTVAPSGYLKRIK